MKQRTSSGRKNKSSKKSGKISKKRKTISSSSNKTSHKKTTKKTNEPFIQALKGTRNDGFAVDIIIPIYNSFEFTRRCIDSVLLHSDLPFSLCLINDHSTDPRIRSYLDELSQSASMPDHLKNIRIIHQEQNLGYIKTVNRGLSLSENHVILLNTDTEVPNRWLSRMIEPIVTRDNIGTVTPFSNSADICSFPVMCEDNELPNNLTLEQMDALFVKYGSSEPVELPTAVGFCMAMNRRAIEAAGYFSEEYGEAYGEENDWCLRVKRLGFHNVLIPNLFVYHKHGGSFSQYKPQLRQQLRSINSLKLQRKYPHYSSMVSHFIREDPIKEIRSVLYSSVLACSGADRHGLLIITHSLGGGSQLYLKHFLETHRSNKRLYVMSFHVDRFKITDYQSGAGVHFTLPADQLGSREFSNLISMFRIDEIFINQLATLPVMRMIRLITESRVPYRYIVHDFLSACPTYVLRHASGDYCGAETDISKCTKCLAANGKRDIHIGSWRSEFHHFLKRADEIMAPSESAKLIVNRYYPDIEITVRPHTMHTSVSHTFRKEFCKDAELNVAFLGAISDIKGSRLVYELRDAVQKRNLPIRITVIGYTQRRRAPYRSKDRKFVITGRYDPRNTSALLAQYRTSLVVISSIIPETFSYTTHEALSSGYPVITFDLGSPADKVKELQAGWILHQKNSASILQLLQSLVVNREEILSKAHRLDRGSEIITHSP